MKLKETEKSELEKITLNKSELGNNNAFDEKRKSKMMWSAQKDKI